MKKIILQGTFLLTIFFGTWYLLSKIDFITIFGVEMLSKDAEEKIGDAFWSIFKNEEKEITSPDVHATIDSLLTRICTTNNINRDEIKMHIVQKNEINAFALPNKHIVVYSETILEANNEAELCGIICHELAHAELGHVAKKLAGEIGLTLIISAAGGNASPEIIKKAIKTLTSSAYSRSLEKEADLKAVEYLVNANIDTEPFANFMLKIDSMSNESSDYLDWISTHPDLKERAEYIRQQAKSKKILPIISAQTWLNLKEQLQ